MVAGDCCSRPGKSGAEIAGSAEIAAGDCIGSGGSSSGYSMSALVCCSESGTDPINYLG